MIAPRQTSQIPYIEPGTLLFRFLDHRTNHFWFALTDMLTEQKLYLSSRVHFNDAFDSRPEIDDDLRPAAIRKDARKLVQNPWNSQLTAAEIAVILDIKARGRTLLNKRQVQGIRTGLRRSTDEFLDECGLTSFSLYASHPLLWGHYAAGFTGVCAVFRRNRSMQSGLCLCAKVSYVDRRPHLPLSLFYEMRQAQRAGKSIDEMTNRIFFLSFLHKSKEWEYEQEARIYYPFEASRKIRFDRDELVGIILGPKSTTDLEQRLRTEVGRRAPSIMVERANLSPSGFGITTPASFASFQANVA